jgi:hypothetical protein
MSTTGRLCLGTVAVLAILLTVALIAVAIVASLHAVLTSTMS